VAKVAIKKEIGKCGDGRGGRDGGTEGRSDGAIVRWRDGAMERLSDGAMERWGEKRKTAVIRSFRFIRVPISNHFPKISTFVA